MLWPSFTTFYASSSGHISQLTFSDIHLCMHVLQLHYNFCFGRLPDVLPKLNASLDFVQRS